MNGDGATIVIAAHNEEAVIGRCLEALRRVMRDGVRVVVVCNGCTDSTAERAREHGPVIVVELEVASKVAALREGDRLAGAGPRIYLDADVVLTSRAAGDVIDVLRQGRALAGRPPVSFDYARAGLLVRRWYWVRERLPSIQGALWGAGCYAVSPAGRARFGAFPDIVSDDLFIDSLFSADEVEIVDTDPVVVRTPRSAADLVRILRRSYRTQAEVHATGETVTTAQRGQLRDLAALLRRAPHRLGDVGIYVAVVLCSRLSARRARGGGWERDESSREAASAG